MLLLLYRSIHNFVEEYKSRNLPLHCLINNAGLQTPPDGKTEDGLEVSSAPAPEHLVNNEPSMQGGKLIFQGGLVAIQSYCRIVYLVAGVVMALPVTTNICQGLESFHTTLQSLGLPCWSQHAL